MANQSFKQIKDRLERLLRDANRVQIRSAMEAYRAYATALRRSPIQGNQFMAQEKDRLFGIVRRHHIGRMIMFFYDPKWANKLPYYDNFPLVIPIQMYDDGFLGLNLHYLPPLQRAKLLDALLSINGDTFLNERKKLLMSYQILRIYVRSGLYIPCVKRYLYSHMRSRFFLINPEDWYISILLPTERFRKANKQRVYNESMNKVRKGR